MLYQTLCYALAAALGRLKVLGGVLWPRVALAGIIYSTNENEKTLLHIREKWIDLHQFKTKLIFGPFYT